ncbi:MAG: hypothetical protein AB8I08_19415 [Sandaracinaceae bacterium]
MTRTSGVVLLLSLALWACDGAGEGDADASVRLDAQVEADAGDRTDAGRELDAGSDGGRADAGRADAGAMADAGDAGPPTTMPCIEPGRPLPVVPCGVGFGMETPAGSGRHLDPPTTTVHRVTTLAASGPGSLAACAEASGPRVCVFEVSGVIERTEYLRISNPYITIAGQTAPSPGVSIHGAGIHIEATDVLISHLRVRVGDRPDGPPVHNRDAIRVSYRDGEPRRIVIDHASLAFSSDEMVSVWYEAGDITLYETLMGHPLHDSIHVREGASGPAPHGFGVLFGQETDRVALVRSVLAHHQGRNPLSRADGMVMLNNVVYGWGSNITQLGSVGGSANRAAIVGNIYSPGPGSTDRPAINTSSLPAGSAVFLADNVAPDVTADPWSIVEGSSARRVDAPPVVFEGYAPRSTDGLEAALLGTVGAWPSARDAVDERLVREVREQSGRLINCVEADGSSRCDRNAGGWPTLAENSRALTLPERPDEDDDGDGYTNLEAWLFSFTP